MIQLTIMKGIGKIYEWFLINLWMIEDKIMKGTLFGFMIFMHDGHIFYAWLAF